MNGNGWIKMALCYNPTTAGAVRVVKVIWWRSNWECNYGARGLRLMGFANL